ncbi:DMT family transporter [Candidatus Babeliales bacterium]|nr:DMT family transporter [Candidatus Babeliales bacterium]
MVLFAILMYALMGLAFPFGKWALQCTTMLSPAYVIAFRMIPAGLGFIIYHFWTQKLANRFRWSDLWFLFIIGLTGVYLHLVLEYWSLKYLDTVKANFIYSLSPFITAFLSYFLISERLSGKQWKALLIGFVGMVPIILSKNVGEFGLASFAAFSLPELAMLFSTIALDYSWFSFRTLSARGHSLHLINGAGMLIGGFLSAGHFLFFHGFQLFPVHAPINFLWLSLVLVLVSNITTYNIYSYLLKKYSVTFLSFAGFILPIFGALYGKLIYGESITWHYGVALFFIALGLWLFHKGSVEKGERAHL